MRRFLPFLEWLPNYKKNWFLKDLVAGVTVGIILVPQGMAYAMIAGLPPVYGLYASLIPVLVYALLGTSRHLAMGPVAMDSLLVAAGLGTLALSSVQEYITMAILLAFLVGAIQILLGLFRMGFLVNFMSKPVISGFTSGAAFIIIFSQIKHFLGASIENSSQFHRLAINAFEKVGDTNLYDFAIGTTGMFLIVLFKKWDKRIPGILLAVVFGILAVSLLNLESYGVKLVGNVPGGLPFFQLPEISIHGLRQLWPIAITLALVGYLEAVSIGKAIEDKNGEETIDANQELVAIGASNMIGSFFRSFPITASFSRSAISSESGGKTNVAGIVSVILVAATLLFLTPLFYYLPNAVLASIIMVSVFGLIDVGYAKDLWKHRKDEFVILLITFLATLFVGIKEGILIGVLFSLLLMVYRTSKPHFAVLGNVRNTDYYKNVNRFEDEIIIRNDLLIVRFDAQLYFGNASYFKKELFKYIDAKGSELKAVILNAEAINYIDSSAALMLTKVIRDIHGKNLQFYVAGAIGPTRDIIFGTGIINELHKEYLFVQIKEAVAYFDNPQTVSPMGSKVAYQNKLNGN